uniref:Large ribosomal subunit protein uL23c n=1 Tax=Gelidium elegans TaxID=37200 RepID=A0A141SDU5_GELEL|nr:ribosomal protein L23 [Gelidium elegans]AMK96463.1 ribosomal protein L23 [Gelidium elegans]
MTNKKYSEEQLIELIKYPLLTDKTTKLIEENQYSFAVSKKANKSLIKMAIEYIFQVKVKNINTSNQPDKKRRVGKFIGRKSSYKKAIVTLHDGNTINLFPEN